MGSEHVPSALAPEEGLRYQGPADPKLHVDDSHPSFDNLRHMFRHNHRDGPQDQAASRAPRTHLDLHQVKLQSQSHKGPVYHTHAHHAHAHSYKSAPKAKPIRSVETYRAPPSIFPRSVYHKKKSATARLEPVGHVHAHSNQYPPRRSSNFKGVNAASTMPSSATNSMDTANKALPGRRRSAPKLLNVEDWVKKSQP